VPESDPNVWHQLLAGLGVFAGGIFGKFGYDRVRDLYAPPGAPPGCPASLNGGREVVEAIHKEGAATRAVLYSNAEKQSAALSVVGRELAIIKDRLQRQ